MDIHRLSPIPIKNHLLSNITPIKQTLLLLKTHYHLIYTLYSHAASSDGISALPPLK